MLSNAATRCFGGDILPKTQLIQTEQSDTFDAMTRLIVQIDSFLNHRKSLEADEARRLMAQAESEASVRAARAEAEAAKRAA